MIEGCTDPGRELWVATAVGLAPADPGTRAINCATARTVQRQLLDSSNPHDVGQCRRGRIHQGRIFRGRRNGHGLGSRPDFQLNVDGRGLIGDEPDVFWTYLEKPLASTVSEYSVGRRDGTV